VNPLPIFAVLTPPEELLLLDCPGFCRWAPVALLSAIALVVRAVTVLDSWFFFESAPTGSHLTELAVIVVAGVSAVMFARAGLRRLAQVA
jgi:hypothetical protein